MTVLTEMFVALKDPCSPALLDKQMGTIKLYHVRVCHHYSEWAGTAKDIQHRIFETETGHYAKYEHTVWRTYLKYSDDLLIFNSRVFGQGDEVTVKT